MKLNTTGKADIVVKAYTDYAAGKTFKKGQPITILKDVSYNISFNAENREVKSGTRNLLGFANYAPYQITIEPINITSSLADILYKQKIKEKTFDLPINVVQVSDNTGTIYLNEVNDDGSILQKGFFILNEKGEVFLAANINYGLGQITDLEPEKPYHISYYIEEDIEFGYKLGQTRVPYFSLEIRNRDDYGKQGINTFIKIPKTALIIDPELNFDRDNITNTSLTFNILDEDIEIIFH